MRTNFKLENEFGPLFSLCIIFILTFDFIPSFAKLRTSTPNLGYFKNKYMI